MKFTVFVLAATIPFIH